MNSRLKILSVILVICAGILPTASAQTAATEPSGRFLLVFETSSSMKTRISSEQYAVERLFFSMMNGQLSAGDTIGLWTFDSKLHTGDFPLQHWQPQHAAAIASDVTNFLARQHYSRGARFAAMMPDLNNLARSSERLTVLIFCDGEQEIQGTPFDKSINGTFKEHQHALKKAGQTFIVVLRSQLGQYTGYSVNSSGVGVDFPPFPPLPEPAPPIATVKTNPPAPAQKPSPAVAAPVIHLPPLVIVGTNVGTNLIPAGKPATVLTNKPSSKKEPSPPVAVSGPKSPPLPQTPISPTNASSAKRSEADTNSTQAFGAPQNPAGLSRTGAMAIGAALLVTAIVLIIVVLSRSRKKTRSSLISSAMKKK